MTTARFLALTPALLLLVLLNGLREELWFRALFPRRYGRFLGPWGATLLTALIVTAFHAQVQYTPRLLPFLGFTVILGVVLGFTMQRSGSLLSSALLHAGTDIPGFVVYLSYASR